MGNKQILTKAMITKFIEAKYVNNKSFFKYIFYFLAVFLTLMSIGFLMSSDISAFMILLIFGCAAAYFGYRMNKTAKRNKTHLTAESYRIVKTRMTECICNEDSDGDSYVMKFEGGASYWNTWAVGKVGDICYLLYFEGKNEPIEVYNGNVFTPADDLIVEEALTAEQQ